MNTKLLVLFSTIFLISCMKSNKIKDENEIYIPIDVSKASILDQNEYLGETKYVSLETTQESLIKNIDKVFLFEDNIIVFDKKLPKILLFGNDGKFKRQIGTRGDGPDEYAMINDVFFEESTGLIYIHERLKNIIFVYNLEGDIVDKTMPKFHFNSFCKTKDGFWLYTCFRNNNPNGYNLMLVDHSMQKMIGGYFPQNPNFINAEMIGRFQLDDKGIAYFTYPTSSCVYKLSESTPEVLCRIDFGNKTAPYEEIAMIETREEYDKLLEKNFYQLGEYYLWNDILIFSFSESSLFNSHTTFSGYYNFKDLELNIYKGTYSSNKWPQSSITCTSGSSLIFNIFPFELDENSLELIQEQINEKLDDDSNPVLIICNAKE